MCQERECRVHGVHRFIPTVAEGDGTGSGAPGRGVAVLDPGHVMRFLEYHPDPGRAAAALDAVDVGGGQDGPVGVEHLQEELGVVAEVVGDRRDGDGRVLQRATQAARRVDQPPVGPAGVGERGAVVEEAAEDLLEVAAAGVGEPPGDGDGALLRGRRAPRDDIDGDPRSAASVAGHPGHRQARPRGHGWEGPFAEAQFVAVVGVGVDDIVTAALCRRREGPTGFVRRKGRRRTCDPSGASGAPGRSVGRANGQAAARRRTVRSRIPRVALSADSGTTGKVRRRFHSSASPDQS